jgi:putative peptide zinc metalloprotease protein
LVGVDQAVFGLGARCVTIGRNPDNDIALSDPRVSRYHARVWREPNGYRVEDLDSLNGTTINDTPVAGTTQQLDDQDVISVAGVRLRFEQPRGVAVPGRTYMDMSRTLTGAPSGQTARPPGAVGAGGRLEQRPRRRSGWSLKRQPAHGEARYVLRNASNGSYLQLTERDLFLWNHMDGENTVRDLLFLYAEEYGQLALPRIEQLLAQLKQADLVAGMGPPKDTTAPSVGKKIGHGVFQAMTGMQISVSASDRFLAWLYRAFAWRFFTRTAIVTLLLVDAAGIAAFVLASREKGMRQPFNLAVLGIWGVIISALAFMSVITVHEFAHALATKSYGRKVRRAGLMLMLGLPYAFVDTTDAWMEGRGARILVSLAGPTATLGAAAIFSLGAAFGPGAIIPGICYLVAFGLYMNTLYNFNPVIPTDGYYAISDILDMPRLREEAKDYAKRGFWRDVVAGRLPSGRNLALFFYGAITVVATLGFIGLGALAWDRRLGRMVHDHLTHPFDYLFIAGGVIFLMFPVWLGPASKIYRQLRSRLRRPEKAEVEQPVPVHA